MTARGTLGRCYIITDDDEFYFRDGMITWLSKFNDSMTPLFIAKSVCRFRPPGRQIESSNTKRVRRDADAL